MSSIQNDYENIPKEELRKMWIAALRSGKFNQGTEILRHKDEFCCLGVLCEISGITMKEINGRYHCDNGNSCYIPARLRAHMGLRSDFGEGKGNSRSLVDLNDQLRKTFAEIADLLEKDDTYFNYKSSLKKE